MKIIRNIKRHASSKRYFPYYLKSGSQIPLGPLEFIIVPNVGVLLCLGANSENKFDSAYLYRDSSSIDIYTNLLKQALNQSSSLLKFFFSLENTNSVLSEIIKIEEKVGERLSISEKLSEITIPQNIYNKYTMMHSRCFQTQFHDNDISESTNNEISENIEFHKRRLDAFESEIKYNKFYCIFDKSFIEHFIKTGHYNLFLTISLEDIKLHLIHIINLLKKHENFEIALFDENIHNYKPKINWFLKGHEAMSIQSPKIGEDEDIEQIDSNNVYENLISNIYEPTIIHAFRHEFYSLWNDIPNENRDKKQVISWFENIVNSIKV